VTVPARGSEPSLLWQRFSDACGIDPRWCDVGRAQPNESLGAESAALLQRIGPMLRDAIDADSAKWTEQYRWLRRYIGHELLVPQGGRAITLRPEEARILRERSVRSTALLRQAGYDVIGDLADLTAADEATARGVHPDDVTAEQMLEVLMPLAASLLRRVRDEAARARSTEPGGTEPLGPASVPDEEAGVVSAEPEDSPLEPPVPDEASPGRV
jgi:hypothetical protein